MPDGTRKPSLSTLSLQRQCRSEEISIRASAGHRRRRRSAQQGRGSLMRLGARCSDGGVRPGEGARPPLLLEMAVVLPVGEAECLWRVCRESDPRESREIVRRQLLLPVSDNYISLWTTTTLLAKQPWLPKLVLTGAEDKALQGCNLSAASGARPGSGRGLLAPAGRLGWQGCVKSRRSGGRASSSKKPSFLIRPPSFSSLPAPSDSCRCSVPESRCDGRAGRWRMPWSSDL